MGVISCKNSDSKKIPLTNTFTDSAAKIQMKYPASWTFDSSLAKIIEDLTHPQDVFQENITLGAEIVPPGIPLDDFAKSFCLRYKLLDSNYKQLSYENSDLNGLKSKKVVFTTQYGDLHYKSMVQVTLKDSFGYFLQANALDTSYTSHENIFNAILNSFQSF